MLALSDEIKGIEMDITLEDRERALLVSFAKSEVFDILQRLMEDQVKKHNIRLINTDPIKPQDVLVNHNLAHAVGTFYIGFMTRLKQELDIVAYNNRLKNGMEPEAVNPMQIGELA